MDLRHLQTLVVLAEELHYGRAARRLCVVQSAVTRTIQDLETEIGVMLFHRSKRRVELTPPGSAIVVRAREILAAADKATAECRAIAEGKHGRLRIAFAGMSGLGYLPEALRALRRDYPDIDIELMRMGSAEQIAALEDGLIDVALTHNPLDGDDIVAQPVLVEKLYAILPADHPLATAPSIPTHLMLREVIAILPRSNMPEIFRSLAALSRRHAMPTPRVVEVDDISHMMTLVAAGLAVSHLPESAARVEYRGVVAIPLEPAYELTLYALRRKSRPAALVTALLAVMPGEHRCGQTIPLDDNRTGAP